MLKLDPSNTTLLAQKHNLLQKEIEETKNKLNVLKEANKKAGESAKNYDAWAKAYEPIRQEMEKTKSSISDLKKKMKELEEVGDIDTEEYKKLQAELKESNSHLKELQKQAKATSDEFGNPISTEQYDALQREIIETEQHLKTLKKTAGSGSATLEKVSTVTGKVGNKMKSAGQAIMPASAAMAGLGAVSVNTANEFESAMSQAAGALNMPMSQMGELRDLAIQTGQETIFSAKEAGQAITELAKGGLSEADIKAGALKATMDLAASSGMELGNAANVVVQAMGAFGLSAEESAAAANALAGAAAASSTDVEPLTQGLSQAAAQAKNAGWSIQETTAVLGKFADAGINGSDAGTSLKTMLQRLAAPTETAAKKIKELEINTRDSQGNLLGASEMAEELQNKLGGLSPAARDAALQTIFGSDAMRAATVMMNSGSEGLATYIKATNDQEAAQRLANSQMGEGQKAIEEMKGSLETAAITIGSKLAPVITKVVEFITDLVNKFSELPNGVQNAILIIGGLIAVAGPLLMIIGQILMAISAINGAMSTLEVTVGAVIGIIAGVIAAITAIIAVIQNWGAVTEWFGNLWTAVKEKCIKAWQGICSFFTETIPQAWDSLVGKFQGVQAWWSGIWQQVGDFFSNIWNSICSFFTEIIPQAWQNVVSWFQGIPAWWAGIWQQVADFFTNVWNDMMQNPVLAGIVNTITALWQNATVTLENIWTNIQTIAGAAWEFIKNVILGPVLLLIDLVTGDFENLKSDAQNIWENIKNAAVQIWTSLKDLVSNIVQGLITHTVTIITGFQNTLKNIWTSVKETASNLWTSLKNFVIQTATNLKNSVSQAITNLKDSVSREWQNMKNAASQAWQNIKEFVVQTANNLKESAVNTFQNLVSGIRSKLSSVTSTVKNGFQGAISFLKSLPSQAVKWGKDFMQGMINGIKSMINRIVSTVKGVADKIRSFLHFSRPDEGPLRDYETWMPDFMEGLAKGIERNRDIVQRAVEKVSSDMKMQINPMVEMHGSGKAGTTEVNFYGNYNFESRTDIDYFMNQAALRVARAK